MRQLWNKLRSKALVLGDQVFVSACNFLLAVIIVRILGLHIFGEYSLVMIIAQGVLGINQAIISAPFQSLVFQSKAERYLNRVKGLQILFLLIFILFSFITYWTINLLTPLNLEASIIPMIVFGLGYLLFDINRKILIANSQMLLCTIKDVLSLGSQVIIIYYFHFNEISIHLDELLWAMGLCYLIIEVPIFLFFKIPALPNKTTFQTHWNFGKWLLGNSVLQWFSGNFYLTVGASILGVDIIGIVRLGQSTIGLSNILLQAMENYVPPVASKIYAASGWSGLKRFMISYGIKGTLFILVLASVMVLLKDPLWQLLYGPDQIQFSFILYWFGVIMAVNFIAYPLRYLLRTLQLTRVMFESYILSSIFGFATAHLFINQWGIHGICLGLILTQVILELWYIFRLANKKLS